MGGALEIKELEATREEVRARAAWLLAIDLANERSGVGFSRIHDMPGKRGRGSASAVTEPRRLALYLATTVANVTSRPLGKAAGVHPSTVSHHVEVVADARDEDPVLDALLDALGEELIWRAASIVMENLRYRRGGGA